MRRTVPIAPFAAAAALAAKSGLFRMPRERPAVSMLIASPALDCITGHRMIVGGAMALI